MIWLKQIFYRHRLYSDLSDEMQQHLEEKIEELVATGMPKKEATAAARRSFGNLTLTENDGREVWQWPRIESLFTDIRDPSRMLRRTPGCTAVAVLPLAVSIGITLAIFQ